jgi:2'-5' RNA ligase
VRLFIALPLPHDIAARAFAVLPDLPGLRRVEPELMHLTLAFLGSTPDDRLSAVVDAVSEAASGRACFDVELDHAGRFPKSGPPRVAWLGMSAGADDSSALAVAVRDALAKRSIAFDEKAFRPHVTLGRVRETATRDEARAIGLAIEAARVAPLRFHIDAVHVIESHVSSKGPRYTSRAAVPLSVGGKRVSGSPRDDRRTRDDRSRVSRAPRA